MGDMAPPLRREGDRFDCTSVGSLAGSGIEYLCEQILPRAQTSKTIALVMLRNGWPGLYRLKDGVGSSPPGDRFLLAPTASGSDAAADVGWLTNFGLLPDRTLDCFVCRGISP